MKRFAVVGAGGCGRGVMPFVRERLSKEMAFNSYDLIFVDDNCPYTKVNGHSVLSYDAWLDIPAEGRFISIAIANSKTRSELAHRCIQDKIEIFEARANNVVQFDDVEIGEGAILCPFVTLTSNIRIGKHFHANIYSYVEHDCVIGDYVTFAPGVKCNGNIHIEDHAYIGSGAVIKQGAPGEPLVIGRGAIVGMGAVVTKSVPPNTIVVGNPARPMNKT